MILPFTLREFREADLADVLRINQEQVPKVGEADEAKIRYFAETSPQFLVADVDHRVAAFLIMLGPETDYQSHNYRWFRERYENFFYVDRVAVEPRAQGIGLGKAFYQAAEERAAELGYDSLTAEVNTRPRNQKSLDFHAGRGFVTVGSLDSEDGTKTVAMLRKVLG
jgi:hypothetical protein